MPSSLLEEAEIFYGEATPAEARAYVRLTRPDTQGDLTLAGKLWGPFCRYAQTLPLTVPLQETKGRLGALQAGDAEKPQTLIAEVIIPDPCFWTPELPFIYRVQLELRRGTQVIDTDERLLGIRRLGVRGQDLFFEGKRWVLRGIRVESTGLSDVIGWHESIAAVVVPNPPDALCEEFSLAGILLVAELHGTASDIARKLAWLARWPAVGVAILECTEPLGLEIRRLAPNVLLGQRTRLDEITQTKWPHFAVCDASDLAGDSGRVRGTHLPVMAERRLAQSLQTNEARAECDRLQSDLADNGDYAAYVV